MSQALAGGAPCHAGTKDVVQRESNSKLRQIAVPVGLVSGLLVGLLKDLLTIFTVTAFVIVCAGLWARFRNSRALSGSGKDPAGLGFWR